MSAQLQGYPCMTVEEFHVFVDAHPEGKFEYIDGHLRDLGALLMAGGTKNHSVIAGNIITALNNALRAKGRHCNVCTGDAYFKVNENIRYLPDVTVTCDEGDLNRNAAVESPSLVVEVLSTSTMLFDHTEKLRAYSSCPSIQEYLLVDSTEKFVEVFHRLPDGSMAYRSYKDGDTIVLSGLGFNLTIADIYYGLSLN